MRWRRGAAAGCRAKLSQRVPNHSTRKRAVTGDRRRTECTRRHAETSAVRNEALVERDSVDCGRWREQQQLSDRRGSRRRPSTAELGGNFLRCGDGPDDAHGPAAAGADGDVDAEDAGEERHPGHARRGSIAELSVQQGGDGGELELAARDEEGELLGRGFGLVGTRHDDGAQPVVGREHAVVQDGVARGGGTSAHSRARKVSGVIWARWPRSDWAS